MRFAFIEPHAAACPVRLMCRVPEVSPSGHYAWRSRPESPRALANRQLVAQHHGRHGSPRLHAALRAEGHRCSRGRVARRMRAHGIRALAGQRLRPCPTDSGHTLAVAPNLLAQGFEAAAPQRLWLADITCIPTGEGWLHLAAILDLATRKVVGWAMRDHLPTELPRAALIMAAPRQRPGKGLIPPSDRGSQYAAEPYAQQLGRMNAVASMSRTGCCCGNAPMESFFHTLRVELVRQHRWTTREKAKRDLFAYMEGSYNRDRIHSALGHLTPEQAERMARQPRVHRSRKGSERSYGLTDVRAGAQTSQCHPLPS